MHSNSQWGDLLTSVSHGYPASGQSSSQGSLTYDAIGNPLNYFNGKNSYVFTWQNGRQLATIKRGTSTVATYAYNQDGIRTSKICGNSKHEYYLDGDKVVREVETRVNNGNLIKDSQYFYDARGYISSATVLYYNSTGTSYTTYNFLFRTNMQGDVIEIYNTSGSLVMGITYDAWGNFTDTISSQDVPPTIEQAIALGLPFRYRSYYYDSETGFYYLNSRYYDPQIRRFINADGYVNANGDLNGFNMFAYCSNNPVMCVDYTGNASLREHWNNFKNFLSNIFGASATVTATTDISKTEELPAISPITVTTGLQETIVEKSIGDSSKPISVYANAESTNYILSSTAGLKINIKDFTLNISLGLDNTGVSGSYNDGTNITSFGVSANISELKLEYNNSVTTGNKTTYTKYGVSGWFIAAAVYFVNTGDMSVFREPAYSR